MINLGKSEAFSKLKDKTIIFSNAAIRSAVIRLQAHLASFK